MSKAPVITDPVTGPIPRAEFAAMVAAPHGQAAKAIRKFDPMWGRAAGEKIKWRVTLQREVTEEGTAIVEASSEKEAEEIVDKMKDHEIDWEPGDSYGGSTIMDVEPLP